MGVMLRKAATKVVKPIGATEDRDAQRKIEVKRLSVKH